MRWIVLTLGMGVLALSAGWVLAENAATPAAGAGGDLQARGEHIAERLGLSAEQREQMKAILKAANEEAQGAADREAKAKTYREAMEKIKSTVLNDEQRKKWEEVRKGAGDRAREHAGEMFERLNLTPEQKDAVKTIMQAAREQAQGATDREAKAKILRDAVEKVKTTVLTDEQRKKLDAGREGRGPGAGGESPAERVKEHLARLTERLNLTPAQQEAAKEILKAAHEQMQSASDPQAKAKLLREAMEKIRATVLTDDQRKKFEVGREEGKERRGPGGRGAAAPK
ncbi:MAG: Spy/CpxP family protein refolding chaperone [Planctomycetota bacterium]|nr:Spy/CpxP family protein refolding chaperone [Planctomycetota bacterium]